MKKPSVLYFFKENQTDKRTDYKPADNVIAMSILTIQSFSRLTLTLKPLHHRTVLRPMF